ncbi:beta-ketoacyl synthase N-terminal-like domain-containing protein [Streptomyces sp. TRM 70351]|uniref:beta-ketoacyl synthase N-terminal-like domain-containing protein n=1 Tax=Streptomyces sp. TRM 70351 TaxID=3116552 RepID=UPI002E7AF074|nr:beta-ketoacyl synthase N-terminal-like domain-containing protein [Streptomyces sp. TRM 70351]MEE1930428.1 beta-ketoacyl synthase N-terminal-like domain-containing protein [Streptomyces sp. TRM 70351]
MTGNPVVTGLAVAAPIGLCLENYWSAARAARHGIRPLSPGRLPASASVLVAPFDEIEPSEHLPGRLISETDWITQVTLIGVDCAFADARVQPSELPPYGAGVVMTAPVTGGPGAVERREPGRPGEAGPSDPGTTPLVSLPALSAAHIAARFGLKGPGSVITAGQTGGLDAVGHARRSVRSGATLMVAGGFDSPFGARGWLATQASGRLTRGDRPARGYRPFDGAADGHVPGEGGAMLLLEDAGHARRRKAPQIYGEIAGYATAFDPAPGRGRASGLQRAIERALADAGLEPDRIDAVMADAAAVPELDRAEAEAVTKVFGPYGVPVTAPKSLTGRLDGGAGMLDLAAAFLSMRHGLIPPTANVRPSPDYDIDLVTSPREARLGAVLLLARSPGGFNSALVVTPAPPGHPAVRPHLRPRPTPPHVPHPPPAPHQAGPHRWGRNRTEGEAP